MSTSLRQEYDERWEHWLQLQPWSTQSSLGGVGPRLSAVLIGLLRGLFRWTLILALLGLFVGAVWLWFDWNMGGGFARLGGNYEQQVGVSGVGIGLASWNGKELQLDSLRAELDAPLPLRSFELEGMRIRCMPWDITHYPIHSDGLIASRGKATIRLGGDQDTPLSGELPLPLHFDSVQFQKAELAWLEGAPTGGSIKGETITGSTNKKGNWRVKMVSASGRIGWLRSLEFNQGLEMKQRKDGKWELHAEGVKQGQGRVFGLELVAVWDEQFQLSGLINWSSLEMSSIQRSQSAGLGNGSLMGEMKLSYDFNRLRGMHTAGRLEVDPDKPLRMEGGPLVNALGSLFRLGTMNALVFNQGGFEISGDGYSWELDGIRLSSERGVVLGGELSLKGRIDVAQDIIRRLEQSEAEAGANQGDTSIHSAENSAHLGEPMIGGVEERMRRRRERLDTTLEQNELKDEGGPSLKVTGSLWLEFDESKLPAEICDQLVELGAASSSENWLRFEFSFQDLSSTAEIGTRWAQQLRSLDRGLREAL